MAKAEGRSVKLTVVLLKRQVGLLDHYLVDFRLRTGILVSRASLVDTIVEAATKRPNSEIIAMLLERRGRAR